MNKDRIDKDLNGIGMASVKMGIITEAVIQAIVEVFPEADFSDTVDRFTEVLNQFQLCWKDLNEQLKD